jgi:hypothetical protein
VQSPVFQGSALIEIQSRVGQQDDPLGVRVLALFFDNLVVVNRHLKICVFRCGINLMLALT